MCDFLAANLSLCARLLNAACRTNYTEESITEAGKRFWTLARLYNVEPGELAPTSPTIHIQKH